MYIDFRCVGSTRLPTSACVSSVFARPLADDLNEFPRSVCAEPVYLMSST